MSVRAMAVMAAVAVWVRRRRRAEPVRGRVGADYASPYVTFGGGTVHVYPDRADYWIKTAAFEGSELKVSYDT